MVRMDRWFIVRRRDCRTRNLCVQERTVSHPSVHSAWRVRRAALAHAFDVCKT